MRKPIYDFEKRAGKRHKIGWILLAIAAIISIYLKCTNKDIEFFIFIVTPLIIISHVLLFATEEDIANSFRLIKSERDPFSWFKKSKSSKKKLKRIQ